MLAATWRSTKTPRRRFSKFTAQDLSSKEESRQAVAAGTNIPMRVTAEGAWHHLHSLFLLVFLWVNVKPRCVGDPDAYISFFFQNKKNLQRFLGEVVIYSRRRTHSTLKMKSIPKVFPGECYPIVGSCLWQCCRNLSFSIIFIEHFYRTLIWFSEKITKTTTLPTDRNVLHRKSFDNACLFLSVLSCFVFSAAFVSNEVTHVDS